MSVNNILLVVRRISLALVSLSFSVGAYQIPNGVPDPMKTWLPDNYTGEAVNPINGIAPKSWEAASKLGLPAYYIDASDPNATNTKNTFGSPDKPRSTIPEITYEAGSYVEIHGGPYDGGGQIIFTANGTPDKPVWFRGTSELDRAIITGETVVKGHYVIMENLEFIGQKLGFRSKNSSYLHHAVIRNSKFSSDGAVASSSSSVIGVKGRSDQRFHDIIIYNNEIHSYGKSFIDTDPALGATTENDYHGIKVTTNVDRAWVLKNNVYNVGGDSIQIGNASVKDADRNKGTYIADNDFYENLENGVDVKATDETLIIGNRIWGFLRHKNNSSTGAAIIIHSKAMNTWVVNNYIYDSATGVAATDSSLETWVIGNVIKDIKHPTWQDDWAGGLYEPGSAIHFRGGSSGGAINNTIINYDKGVEAASGQYIFSNNILFNRNAELGKDLFVESSQSDNTVKNNLVYSDDGFSVQEKNVNCVSCLHPNSGSFELLTDEAISNTSIALASGMSIQSYLDKYKEVFGTALSKDIYDGNRIQGGIDIGAVENQSSEDTSVVNADITLPLAAEIVNVKSIETMID